MLLNESNNPISESEMQSTNGNVLIDNTNTFIPSNTDESKISDINQEIHQSNVDTVLTPSDDKDDMTTSDKEENSSVVECQTQETLELENSAIIIPRSHKLFGLWEGSFNLKNGSGIIIDHIFSNHFISLIMATLYIYLVIIFLFLF